MTTGVHDMRTDDLINALARDPVPALPRVGVLLFRTLAISVPVAFGLMLMTLGVRDDFAASCRDGWFVLKLVLVAGVAVAGWAAVKATATPTGAAPIALAGLVVLAIAAAGIADLGLRGIDSWRVRLVGENAMFCLVSIPFLSVAPLAGIIYALRDGAPTNPALAGAAAGLLSGSLGALLYGLHCTDDSPLFLMVWYVAAIAMVTGAGALAGRKWLRW